jgi:hypothetical protein
VAFATLIIIRPLAPSVVAQKEGDGGPPAIWKDPKAFEMLSSAAQSLLELKYGRKTEDSVKPVEPAQAPPKGSAPEIGGEASPLSALANPLVNNPAADLTSQKTQSETTIALGGTALIAGFNDSGSFIGGASKFTGFSRSTDMGTSWIDGGTLPTNAQGDAGDPVLARDTTTGRLYFATLQFSGAGIRIFRSDDDAASWMAPTQGAPGLGGSDFADKEWLAVDNFGGAGNGNVYLVIRNFVGGTNAGGIFFFRSTDQGATFGPSGGVSIADRGAFNVQGAFVAVGPDHSVYAFWLDQSAGSGTPNILRVRRSTDFGVTFGAPVNIQTLNTTGTNGSLGSVGGFRTNSFCHAAVHPVSGNIYVAYNDINAPSPTDRGDIYFQQSTDSGATWSARVKLNTDATTNLNWQPTIGVTPDGTNLGVFWNDRRNSATNSRIEYWGRTGTISGSTVTFGPNFKISNADYPAVFGQDPVVNSVYMGDYDHVAADNSFFYVTWGDNRLSASAPDVRFAKVPIAGPGPVISSPTRAISGGNGNGTIDPNECNLLTVTLVNDGSATATGISAALTSSTPGVTIMDSPQSYPDLSPGASATNSMPFKVETSPAYVCGTPVDCTLVVTYTGGSDTINFTLPATQLNYNFTTSTGNAIVPGTADIGNHGDDVTTNIALPFSYTLYGETFTAANVSSNGNLQFTSNSTAFTNACPLPTTTLNDTIIPHWDDLRTDDGGVVTGRGIFTSVSGVAPNRIFNIEWRTRYFSASSNVANFEVRLYEGQQKFDFIYGQVDQGGSSATIGVQKDTGTSSAQFACNTAGSVSSGLMVTGTLLTNCPDGGGSCSCSSLICPSNVTQSNDPGQCGAIVNYPAPTPGGSGCGTITCSPASGSLFPVGTTTVTCTATAGPTCSFTVTVNDTEAPAITCPANQTACATPGSAGTVVTYPAPMATDNCPGVTVACVPPSGSTFPPGTSTVTCTATDGSGNTATCSFTIQVFNALIQDDSNSAIRLMWITSGTEKGRYLFCCAGSTFTGIGTAVTTGNTYTLTHNPVDRRVAGWLEANLKQGKGSFQSPPGKTLCTITDRNTMDDLCGCTVPVAPIKTGK